ncbi:MAG: hypothetical protein M1829_000335 [Trizodia sp. TS-e1964]|nr:MAG: hypothetical protein M1829_000335 [Trizodia sp. TS-e1964]
MHFTSHFIAIPALWLLTSASAINNHHEHVKSMAHQEQARSDGDFKDFLPVPMSVITARMAGIYGPGLRYQFGEATLTSPASSLPSNLQQGRAPEMRRVFYVFCWGIERQMKIWPLFQGKEVASLLIMADYGRTTDSWETYTGFNTVEASYRIGEYDLSDLNWLGYAKNPNEVDYLIRNTLVPVSSMSRNAFEITRDWVDQVKAKLDHWKILTMM